MDITFSIPNAYIEEIRPLLGTDGAPATNAEIKTYLVGVLKSAIVELRLSAMKVNIKTEIW